SRQQRLLISTDAQCRYMDGIQYLKPTAGRSGPTEVRRRKLALIFLRRTESLSGFRNHNQKFVDRNPRLALHSPPSAAKSLSLETSRSLNFERSVRSGFSPRSDHH